jgi:putative transposase
MPSKKYIVDLSPSERKYLEQITKRGKIPRDYHVRPWEKEKIVAFYRQNQTEGYRRITYMMLDRDIVAVSPATTVMS